MHELPYLTADVPALAAVIKKSEEDFFVEELPLYELEGEGDHVHFFVEKRGITTATLVRRVADRFGIASSAVGVAGLKDARAVTRQALSVEHVTPEACLALELEDAEVLWAKRHRNKLKRGHLAGNRFAIVLQDTDASRLEEVREVLERLERTGMPNAFGPQRFGARGDSGQIGGALIAGDHREVAELIAGRAGERDFGAVRRARELFDAGEYSASSREWPRGFELSAKLSFAMHKNRGRASRATRCLSKREKAFFVSAWQSELFNQFLAERMPAIDQLFEGEFAWNHGSRRSFQVRDLEEERTRAARFEVSPASPLIGPSTTLSSGQTGNLERRVLQANGIEIESLDPRRFAGIEGARRPLRVRPLEVSAEALDAETIELRFCLPEGAFATSLLREIGKDKLSIGTDSRE